MRAPAAPRCGDCRFAPDRRRGVATRRAIASGCPVSAPADRPTRHLGSRCIAPRAGSRPPAGEHAGRGGSRNDIASPDQRSSSCRPFRRGAPVGRGTFLSGRGPSAARAPSSDLTTDKSTRAVAPAGAAFSGAFMAHGSRCPAPMAMRDRPVSRSSSDKTGAGAPSSPRPPRGRSHREAQGVRRRPVRCQPRRFGRPAARRPDPASPSSKNRDTGQRTGRRPHGVGQPQDHRDAFGVEPAPRLRSSQGHHRDERADALRRHSLRSRRLVPALEQTVRLVACSLTVGEAVAPGYLVKQQHAPLQRRSSDRV
jgi:hypothetical protein